MDIQEAIQHCLDVAAGATEQGKCQECAADHEQLAEWMTVLKQIAEIFNCAPGDPAQLKWLCDKLRGWQQAEQDGRLVVLPEEKAQWLKAILDERERQDQKWGFPQDNTYGEWGSILAEETGELCKELNELNFGSGDHGKMETEAVQVAAVALSILEHAAVALGVTEQVAKALCRRPTRPKCFYGDADLCRGMSVNNDDEPIEACKRCWYCSAGYRQLEAEAAVEVAKTTKEEI